jgi:hypothetical protein
MITLSDSTFYNIPSLLSVASPYFGYVQNNSVPAGFHFVGFLSQNFNDFAFDPFDHVLCSLLSVDKHWISDLICFDPPQILSIEISFFQFEIIQIIY